MIARLLAPGARPVIGHRGAAAHAPENTIASFDAALAAGADAIELDVHVTEDGHAVVLHDPALDRTTDERGAVSALTLARVQGADAGARFTPNGLDFPFRGRGVRVPSLDDVLARFPEAALVIELKTVAAGAAARPVLERHGAAARVLLGAFDRRALLPFREPPWLTCAAQPELVRLLARLARGGAPQPPAYRAIAMPPRWHGLPLPLRAIARDAALHGVPVHLWVVDRPAEARRHWERGVSGIITNDPAAILAARDTRD